MRSRHNFTVYDLEMVLVAAIWGGNFSVSKFALAEIPPLTFSGIRFAAASALLLVIARQAGALSPLPRRTFWGLVGLGVIGNTFYQTAFMIGLSLTSATNSAMIVAALPVVVALLGTVLGIERTSPLMWVGVVLGTAGVTLVVTARGIDFGSGALRGDLLVLFATLCWSLYTVGVRRVGQGVNPLQITVITATAGAPGLMLLGAPGFFREDWQTVSAETWGALAYAGLLSLVFAYVLYNRAVQGIGSARTAIYNCLTPLVAMLIAWLTLGEVPTPLQFAGVGLVIAGVLVSVASARSEPKAVVVPE
ncbi:MAG: DMT family transporter [Gemmatimonadales bacterium]